MDHAKSIMGINVNHSMTLLLLQSMCSQSQSRDNISREMNHGPRFMHLVFMILTPVVHKEFMSDHHGTSL